MLGDLPTALVVVLQSVAVVAAFVVLPVLAHQAEHEVLARRGDGAAAVGAGRRPWRWSWSRLTARIRQVLEQVPGTPAGARLPMYRMGPALVLVPLLLLMSVLPWTPTWTGAASAGGLLVVVAMLGLSTLGVALVGWSSGTDQGTRLGVLAAQHVSRHLLPVLLVVASSALAAGTLSSGVLGHSWSAWWLLWQMPGAVVLVIAGLTALARGPFGVPTGADPDPVGGLLASGTGLHRALGVLTEYVGVVVVALLVTTVYLGGWAGPWSDTVGVLWTLLKVVAVLALLIWLRTSWETLVPERVRALVPTLLLPVAGGQLALTLLVTAVTA